MTATISPNGFSEDDLLDGGTLTITLTSDTWISTGFDAQRQGFIDGLAAATDGGWNTNIQQNLTVTDVVRTSDTVVTITLPIPVTSFSSDEQIAVTFPYTALDIDCDLLLESGDHLLLESGDKLIIDTPDVIITPSLRTYVSGAAGDNKSDEVIIDLVRAFLQAA